MKSKILHLLLLPLALALVLTDCAAQSPLDKEDRDEDAGKWIESRKPNNLETCPGTNRQIKGSSFVLVKYGDSFLDVTAKAHVKKKDSAGKVGAIEFKLKPDKSHGGQDAEFDENALVTIVGKKSSKDETVSWLFGQGRGTSSIVVCPDETTSTSTVYYEVKVAGVGTLDPRADVED